MTHVGKWMAIVLGAAFLSMAFPISGARLLGEDPPPLGLNGVKDAAVLIQIPKEISVLRAQVRGGTDGLPWRCCTCLDKVSDDLWSGKLAVPFGPKARDLKVVLEFQISVEGKSRWVKLSRSLESLYVLKVEDFEPDSKSFGFGQRVEVLFEFQFDKDKSKEWKEVKLWHHWLIGSGPHSGQLIKLSEGRWVFRGTTFGDCTIEDCLELTGWLEIDGVGGDTLKAKPQSMKDLGAKVLQMIENP